MDHVGFSRMDNTGAENSIANLRCKQDANIIEGEKEKFMISRDAIIYNFGFVSSRIF